MEPREEIEMYVDELMVDKIKRVRRQRDEEIMERINKYDKAIKNSKRSKNNQQTNIEYYRGITAGLHMVIGILCSDAEDL